MSAAFRGPSPPDDETEHLAGGRIDRAASEPSPSLVSSPADRTPPRPLEPTEDAGSIELHEERLAARKDLVEAGEVVIHTEVDEVPGRLEVDSFHEEIQVEHIPIGRVVSERAAPWEVGDELVVPIYEEQLVVVKRLVLKEEVRVRRVRAWEHRIFEDTVRRERLVVEEPEGTHVVREQYPSGNEASLTGPSPSGSSPKRVAEEGGFFGHLVRKALK